MPFTTCEYEGGACVYGAQSVYDSIGANGSCTNASTPTPADEATTALSAVYEARAPFESFAPMEMPMTASELQSFLAPRASSPLLVVAETREHQVKMRTQLPARWASAPLKPALNASAQPGEHFSFQLAVVNVARGDGQAVQPQTITSVTFSDLRSQVGDPM